VVIYNYVLAKTNMPELAVGPQTNSPLFGRANNPWNLECTPGGSSGGSASAVAAGLSPLDLAGDGGGSIRIPAHFCGVLSLMPTQHRVSSAGLIRSQPGLPNSWHNLASHGPIARSVEDLRLTLSVIEGNDNRTWEVAPPPKETVVEKTLKQLRFAWIDNFGDVPITQDTHNAVQDVGLNIFNLKIGI
jgi:amidase